MCHWAHGGYALASVGVLGVLSARRLPVATACHPSLTAALLCCCCCHRHRQACCAPTWRQLVPQPSSSTATQPSRALRRARRSSRCWATCCTIPCSCWQARLQPAPSLCVRTAGQQQLRLHACSCCVVASCVLLFVVHPQPLCFAGASCFFSGSELAARLIWTGRARQSSCNRLLLVTCARSQNSNSARRESGTAAVHTTHLQQYTSCCCSCKVLEILHA
jgi:hypothetical protein